MAGLGPGGAYRRLLAATGLSNLGDGVRAAALPLLAASLTDRPVLIAGVAAAGSLPWLLFGPVAGVVIDRTDRRRLAAGVDVGRFLLLGLLVVAVASDAAGLPLVYLVALGCGVAETFRDTATATLVPPLVGGDRLDVANGHLVNAEVAGDELLGPPLGGYLFGVAVALPFALNGGLLAVAAALVLSLPHLFGPAAPGGADRPDGGADRPDGGADRPDGAAERRSDPGPGALAGIGRDLVEGARFLARHRRLRTAALLGAVLALADSAWYPILVVYSRQILDLPAAGFGLLLSVGAVGGLAGAFLAARIIRRTGTATAVTGALVTAAVAQGVLGLTGDAVAAGAALAASSSAFGVWNVATLTLRQRLAPPRLLGRINGSYRTLLLGIQPVGALSGGAIAGAFGVRVPFLLGVPVLLAAAVSGHRWLRGGDDGRA